MGIDAVLNLWDYFRKAQNGSLRIEKENINLIKSFLKRLDERNSNENNPSICMHGSDVFFLNIKNFRTFHLISICLGDLMFTWK